MRVGVFGAGGRMGSAVCQAVVAAPDMELVAAVDPHHAGIELSQLGIHGPSLQISGKCDGPHGAEVMVDFTEIEAARENETAEIIELHHDEKIDAPSGTALLTAERMAAASGEWGTDPTSQETVPGSRGSVGPGGIHIHAVRLRGLVAHQEVVLGTTGQSLSIRHDTFDRSSFMPGVLMAIRVVGERPGLTVGLDTLLGI
ncbi:MAG: 4-hydroxy-tetrahydrodipicolinate reductase [Actinobacteria bacterium]|nr:4-hydroxy-tetrahydrodipicolinate reductase [Actinomycetota bacterium]